MALKTILLQLVWCWASKMPRLTGLDRNKPEIWTRRSLKRTIELGFKKSFAHIFQFPVPHARFPLLLPVPRFGRNLLIGRRDGSENVASKMNLRSFGPHRDYSNSLTLSNVGKPSRSWISKNCIQVWREWNFVVARLRPPKKYNQAISCGSRAKTAKKCTKKWDARVYLLFCLLDLL